MYIYFHIMDEILSQNEKIARKKEFYDEKLDREEKVPRSGSGKMMRHQKIVSRFMSSHTPYNSLLLFHSMGVGKTCSAFATTERIRQETWIEPGPDELDEKKN